jgi:hypothetical protein
LRPRKRFNVIGVFFSSEHITNMRVGIHQPHYLPWLRYLQKIAASDVFILLDDVDYTKNGWQNRNKIKGANGWMYLTVPVNSSLGVLIRDVHIAQGDWATKHLRALEMNYSRAPYYDQYIGSLSDLYHTPWTLLGDLNRAMLDYYLTALGVKTRIVRSSDLNVHEVSTNRLIGLCRAVGGTSYYTGEYAVDAYLDTAAFEHAGIGLDFQKWHCPEYRQLYPKAGFIPDLSIPDLLFNVGPDALDLLIAGGRQQNTTAGDCA